MQRGRHPAGQHRPHVVVLDRVDGAWVGSRWGHGGVLAEPFNSIDEVKNKLKTTLAEGDILMVLGAGDIIKLSDSLL